MSTTPKPRKLTEDEYLAIERDAPFKSEFYDGVMYPVYRERSTDPAGAERAHDAIRRNLVAALGRRDGESGGWSASADLRVRASADGSAAGPDLVVVGGPLAFAPENPDLLLNPTAIIEVTSGKTGAHDPGRKFHAYQRIPSLREYVVVAHDGPLVERLLLRADGGWYLTYFEGLDAVLTFSSIPAAVPLADVYAGVTFPENPGGRP